MTAVDSGPVIGIDVGSTTVKCTVVDPATLTIRWSCYQRHEARQAQMLAQMLEAVEAEYPALKDGAGRAFITGSGAGPLAEGVGACFVQEVNAVTLAVEHLHPEVRSVIELGGQDAKIILFQDDPVSGARRVITSMNDKCASGTGATLDKCLLKTGLSHAALAELHFDPERLHHVAAKCGVFAETDIVNLIKAGVPPGEVMNSLADAIVMQNLSVLTRGNTLQAQVLLLGGPNAYLPFLQAAWRLRIPQTWAERGYTPPGDRHPEECIRVPDNAQYYAAFGAVVFGVQAAGEPLAYRGAAGVRDFIRDDRRARLGEAAGPGLLAEGEDLEVFRQQYQVPDFHPPALPAGTCVSGYIGLDGGSTSSKAVLIDAQGELLAKTYRLSQGNPIEDARTLLAQLRDQVSARGCQLEVLGFGATGYAADVLDQSLCADANLVETVAHMMSAQRYCGDDVDVICDIGGQDIKVLFLQNGVIKSFRLSNQCSAGNGMLLQAMADQFGVALEDFADIAFQARLAPRFSYGCAVFLDADRVNFQKEGFSREELFAGLAQVLPKNIWQYVVQIPRLAELGRKFVLQGGTQYNLAAVKAQVDYIQTRVPGAEVRVHPHCGEAGAIGAALEARRQVSKRGQSRFIGLESAIHLEYTTRTDATTRCTFCDNHCTRTFIDTRTPQGATSRYIAGFSCEKGTVESKQAVVALNQTRKRLKDRYPNLVDYEAEAVFRHRYQPAPLPAAGSPVDDEVVSRIWFGCGPVRRRPLHREFMRSNETACARRAELRIGIPRVLNHYMVAPFLRTYLESLGIGARNIVFSDASSEDLWLEGGKYGSVDPCYPAKVTLAHIHQLLHAKQARHPLDVIWFPCITHTASFLAHIMGFSTCPVLAGTPKVARAAFTKERDLFAAAGVTFLDRALNFELTALLRQQLLETWGEHLGITPDENDWACAQGWAAMTACDEDLQMRGRALLDQAVDDHRLVLLMLGRPYHNDPGLNHEVLEEFQALGYPVLSLRAIPKDPAWLQPLFGDDLRVGRIADVFDIRDVWPENYSVNSAQKVWAAKFAARHPHVAVVDLSSFKCGHDAPTYGLIDKILATSRTPFLTLHDLDANKPGGSIKIRVQTFAYALERYGQQLAAEGGEGLTVPRHTASG
ncbi:MAG: hypothetical protein BMS9Abin09_0051 [Gammaproteobacteria bacterium]|nr:MAG: hypothetical protein BMS9Abin09_0051 [Gammaproteobacteria bacterium]